MKKKNIIALVLVILVIGGLLVFAGTHKYEDSHLRKDGYRVRIEDGYLVVDDCLYENSISCKRTVNVLGEEQTLAFEYLNFKENGYPSAIKATINGKEFYYKDGLEIENNGFQDVTAFLGFGVIDKYIIFTITEGNNGRTTTLYAMDVDGNIALEEKEIDKDDMVIKDYAEDFMKVENNTIKVLATRMTGDITYKDDNVCKAKSKDVVEAYYLYTYKDGKFTKKQSETITAKEYIEDNNITCGD